MRQHHPELKLLLVLLLILTTIVSAADNQNQCIQCHQDKSVGQQAFHSFSCVTCHAGNYQAEQKEAAHQGLQAYPGNLSNVEQSCGQCHSGHTKAIQQHLMTTARGMVETTRHVLNDPDDGADIAGLGHSVSDSLLRKLCAGCHLGRDKKTHSHSTLNRGGGCLACHLGDYPETGHVQLTQNISDARCFGCHSRSARISLNYAGLAEFDVDEQANIPHQARLPDGRLVQIRESDVHHQAGMSCVDCHTGQGLMGFSSSKQEISKGVDIQCIDCHVPAADKEGTIQTQRFQTTLDHVTVSATDIKLRLKKSGVEVNVPVYSRQSHPLSAEHARLDCDACHTQWAPLCYGCHTRYDEKDVQYDYLEGHLTPGRWKESRWLTLSDLPPLGVDTDNRIRPFVPGMIFTLEHPDLDVPLSRRLFAPMAPHTTGPSRTCQSCHCNSSALGLGSGKLTRQASGWSFDSTSAKKADGIAEDAWQHWDSLGTGSSTQLGARPLNSDEIQRILNAGVECR